MNDSIGMERYWLEESEIDAEGTVILRLAGWERHRGQYGAVHR